jgi:hypothetical protein
MLGGRVGGRVVVNKLLSGREGECRAARLAAGWERGGRRLRCGEEEGGRTPRWESAVLLDMR